MTVELLVPVARRLILNQPGIPLALQGEVSGVVAGERQARDIGAAFGRTHKPRQPLLVYGPDGQTPILIMGDGVTEAAELEDLALEAMERQRERMQANGGSWFNFDEARERAGAVRRENFDPAFRQALRDSVARQKANPSAYPQRNRE